MTDKKLSATESTKIDMKAIEAKRGDRKRPTRITRDMLVNKGPLVVPESAKRTGFVNFWMRDEAHKFEKYQRVGFDFATDSTGATVCLGRQGEKMYLLEIPVELHDQIKALKNELKLEEAQELQNNLPSEKIQP